MLKPAPHISQRRSFRGMPGLEPSAVGVDKRGVENRTADDCKARGAEHSLCHAGWSSNVPFLVLQTEDSIPW